MDRVSKGNFIDHPSSSIRSDHGWQLTLRSEVSYFSRSVLRNRDRARQTMPADFLPVVFWADAHEQLYQQ
jgi:hypothetical protein